MELRRTTRCAELRSRAQADEAPQSVTMAPYFLARHELTKGQWFRITDGDEPSWYRAWFDLRKGDPSAIGWTHPVETCRGRTAHCDLPRVGLSIPTEAQWEYGARAGHADAVVDREGCVVSRGRGERAGPARPTLPAAVGTPRGRLRRRLRRASSCGCVPGERLRAVRRPRQRVGMVRRRILRGSVRLGATGDGLRHPLPGHSTGDPRRQPCVHRRESSLRGPQL
jgi:hypothetical protein